MKYNENQKFYDFVIREDELQFKNLFCPLIQIHPNILSNVINQFGLNKNEIYPIIFKKIFNNLNAIQNGIIYNNGKDDGEIQLKNYKDYYHLIFEYDVNKLDQIKNILKEKYNIQNINLYKFDQKNLIYIFDNDSNFEGKINSPLFSNLNNRINNYNKDNLIEQKISFATNHLYNYPNCNQVWQLYNPTNFIVLYKFNNIFDQNWYNKFCQNMILFFGEITK